VDKDKDNAETVLAGFLKYATVPIVNMEGCTGHLQALADAITIAEFQTPHRQKLCLGLRIPEHHKLSLILL
jgi:N-succinyl-L-ornithine transcarbamylase